MRKKLDFYADFGYPMPDVKKPPMTTLQVSSALFEAEFDYFIEHHMYPLIYGKENAMPKLRHDHISALTRAQNLLETAVDVRGKPKLNKSINSDIVLLCQIREMLFFALENPTLPFTLEDSVPKPIPVKGDEEPD